MFSELPEAERTIRKSLLLGLHDSKRTLNTLLNDRSFAIAVIEDRLEDSETVSIPPPRICDPAPKSVAKCSAVAALPPFPARNSRPWVLLKSINSETILRTAKISIFETSLLNSLKYDSKSFFLSDEVRTRKWYQRIV